MKTQEEIEHLKRNWEGDPCWDIEETEGFEEHKEELLAFRLQKEKEWENNRKWQLERKAAELGVAGNIKLAEYVLGLEHTLKQVDKTLDRLCDRVGMYYGGIFL